MSEVENEDIPFWYVITRPEGEPTFIGDEGKERPLERRVSVKARTKEEAEEIVVEKEAELYMQEKQSADYTRELKRMGVDVDTPVDPVVYHVVHTEKVS